MILRNNPIDDSLTWQQACAVVRVSRPTLRKMVRDGQLPAPVQVGRRFLFAKGPFFAALKRMLEGEAA